jgi:gentisate 1,2-dioxygenase
MEPGDLIRTPQWSWHEHVNEGSEPMIWADGLDVPLIEMLQVVSVERRPEERLRVKEGQIHPSLYGMFRPAGTNKQKLSAPLHYRWQDTYAALQRLAEKFPDPYDGIVLDYVDPPHRRSDVSDASMPHPNVPRRRKNPKSPPPEHQHLSRLSWQRHNDDQRRNL